MKFTCDQCGTRYSIADEKVERKILKIRCKVCKFVMVVRGSDRTDESIVSMAASFDNQPEVEWYVAIAGQQHGPMPIERVRELIQEEQLSNADLVWNEKMSGWEEAAAITDFAALFAPPKAAVPPPLPPLQSVAPAIVEPPVIDLGESAIIEPDLSLDATNEDPSSIAHAPSGVVEAEEETDQSLPSVSAVQLESVQSPVGGVDTLAYGSPEYASHPLIQTHDEFDEATVMDDGASFVKELLLEEEALAAESDAVSNVELASVADVEATAGSDGPLPSAEDFALADTGQEPEVDSKESGETDASISGASESAIDFNLSIGEPAVPVMSVGEEQVPSLSISDVATAKIIRPPDEATAVTHDHPEVEEAAAPSPSPDESEASTPGSVANAVPSALPTMPVQKRDKKTSVGLVVAAAIIIASAMFCVVWFGLKGPEKIAKPIPKTTVIASQSTPTSKAATALDPSTKIKARDASLPDAGQPTVKDAAPDRGAPASAGAGKGGKKPQKTQVARAQKGEKTRAQAKEPKSKEAQNRKAKARANKSPNRRSTQSNLVAKQKKLKKRGAPSFRKNSLFSGGPGPSSLLPDTKKKEDQQSAPAGLTDGLSQAEVVKVIAQYKKGLNGCYQRQLKREPLRDGRLMLKFRIRPSGRTSNVSIGKKYDGTVLKSCLDALVRRWRFPQFRGDAIDIEYPLIFATRF